MIPCSGAIIMATIKEDRPAAFILTALEEASQDLPIS